MTNRLREEEREEKARNEDVEERQREDIAKRGKK